LQYKTTSGTYNVLAGIAVKQFGQLKYTKPKIAKKNVIQIRIVQIYTRSPAVAEGPRERAVS